MYNVTTSNHCVQEIVTIHKVVVIKSVTKTVVTMPIGTELSFLKQTVLAIANEAWDDYRISKVQNRCHI